jgi:hypothetical protein
MKIRTILGLIVLITAITLVVSSLPAIAGGNGNGKGNQNNGNGGGEPTAGNCLSYPVIWAEGMSKVLRVDPISQDPLAVITDGEWWYWWGTDSDGTPLSCLPDPQNTTFCNDEDNTTANGPLPGPEPTLTSEVVLLSDEEPTEPDIQPLRKVWVQQNGSNIWQAESADWRNTPVNIDWLDWGDSIESVDWTINSKVRCEMVLSKDLLEPMRQYFMYHVDGWGITEMWGISRDGYPEMDGDPVLDEGLRATVYTPCGRLTIQKLLVPREELNPDNLTWVPAEGWTENETVTENLINPPIFNAAVHEATGEGTGAFPAEINVKGKIMYGYTWSARDLNDETENGGEAAGDYRLTFSLDKQCGSVSQNTYFVDGVTDFIENETIVLPVGGTVTMSEEPETGATAVLDFDQDLTYIDIRIEEK